MTSLHAKNARREFWIKQSNFKVNILISSFTDFLSHSSSFL